MATRYTLTVLSQTPERKKNQLVLYDAGTYAVLQRFDAPLTIFSTEISPPYVLAGLQDGDVLVWNIETGDKVTMHLTVFLQAELSIQL